MFLIAGANQPSLAMLVLVAADHARNAVSRAAERGRRDIVVEAQNPEFYPARTFEVVRAFDLHRQVTSSGRVESCDCQATVKRAGVDFNLCGRGIWPAGMRQAQRGFDVVSFDDRNERCFPIRRNISARNVASLEAFQDHRFIGDDDA